MPVRQSFLMKKRASLEKKLSALRAKKKQLRVTEEELQAQIDALEDVTPELEAQVEDLEKQQTETDDAIADILDELDDVKAAIQDLDEGQEILDEDLLDGRRGAEPAPSLRSRYARSHSANFRCRSRCFSNRESMEAFYAQKDMKDFIARVRAMAGTSKRVITGAELAIPNVLLDVVRDNLGEYSKLLRHVRLRQVRGNGRVLVAGKIPEGIWTEMCARLNELTFAMTEIELDGYKVGGFVTICRAVLVDASDVDLGEEIVEDLLRAVGKALDKAIVFGLGPNSKMPIGFVTRLAQTAQPAYWGVNQGDWTDLHTTNLLKLNLSGADGVAYYQAVLGAMGKAKPDYTNGQSVWVMNRATHMAMKAAGLAFNAAGALVSAIDDTMPVEGGIVEELDFMPDGMVAGGFLDGYILAEREGSSWARSDEVLFFEDQVAYKVTARYDGQPIVGEAFVAFTLDNSDVTTVIPFEDDLANEPLNALIVTGATVTAAGVIAATITGATSATPRYAVQATAATVDIHGNDVVIPGKFGWVAWNSGATIEGAAAGMPLHVVELDAKGHILSAGTVALTAAS